jgi:hypothetical protein
MRTIPSEAATKDDRFSNRCVVLEPRTISIGTPTIGNIEIVYEAN